MLRFNKNVHNYDNNNAYDYNNEHLFYFNKTNIKFTYRSIKIKKKIRRDNRFSVCPSSFWLYYLFKFESNDK